MQTSYLTQWILPLALFSIMFGVGMTLKAADFTRLLHAPRAVIVGMAGQLLLLPLLGAVVIGLTALPPLLATGLMILTFAPGGATSNMLTLLARGDTALSITLTAVSSLITPFTLPLLTLLVLEQQGLMDVLPDFPILITIMKMLVVTLLPVGIGMLVAACRPGLCTRMQRPVKLCSLLFMIVIVTAIVLANREALPSLINQVGPVALLLTVCALAAGYGLARVAGLQDAQRVTLAIEVGIQNAGTALLVTAGLLQNTEMSASALIYGVVMQIPAVLILLWRNPGVLRQPVRALLQR
ncbi:MAG: bile acid:sodium symporter family protein [Oceanospirillales bacterium]|uniref:BASS family bile acid:Na+ symporter n=1 Tax=Marinobacterium halophilum TaxID=267374 RepID=A0A2P8EZF1_9GAMM|nr:bile acid:sodium symporter family protein [Marinobacterium halophilum]MBR9828683.1 bile acid:sodium symporter family protein [Oceanospirillales bacterium]PSL14836.1 BASS family bile acid:Na+ symporter [Marinobacterium halophilum]